MRQLLWSLRFALRLRTVELGVAFILLLEVNAPSMTAVAQIVSEPPPLVRLTGALQPSEAKRSGDMLTLSVSIKGTTRLLRVTQVEKLTGRSPDGWRLLGDLFPPQLRCVGPDESLRVLQSPETIGKPLVIEGRLYSGERMLLITSVTLGQATSPPPADRD